MNQSQFLAITCNSLKAREKSRVQGAIAFGFASHWLKNWRESSKPITKRSNRNHVITFNSHLKTALYMNRLFFWLQFGLNLNLNFPHPIIGNLLFYFFTANLHGMSSGNELNGSTVSNADRLSHVLHGMLKTTRPRFYIAEIVCRHC